MQVSALYPSLFGYTVAFAHWLVLNPPQDDAQIFSLMEQHVSEVLSELPPQEEVIKQAEDWLLGVTTKPKIYLRQ